MSLYIEFPRSSLLFIIAFTIKLFKSVSQSFRACGKVVQSVEPRLAMLTNDIEPRIFLSIDIFVKRQTITTK